MSQNPNIVATPAMTHHHSCDHPNASQIASLFDSGKEKPQEQQMPVSVEESPQEPRNGDLLKVKAKLLWACAMGADMSVQHILEIHPSLASSASDDRGCSPLHFACASGNLSLVQKLCGAPFSANVFARAQGYCKLSPIEVAAVHGHLSILKYLATIHGALYAPGTLKGWPAWDKFLQPLAAEGCTSLSPCLEKDPYHQTLPEQAIESVMEGRSKIRQFLEEELCSNE